MAGRRLWDHVSTAKVLQALLETGGNIQKAADLIGMPCSTLKERIRRDNISVPESKSTAKADKQKTFATKTAESGDITIECFGDEITTVDQAIERAGIDLDVFEVVEHTVNSWPTTMKIKKSDDDHPVMVMNWQIKVKLRRKVPKFAEDSIRALISKLESKAPPRPKISRPKRSSEPFLLELALYDPHFGKLAWAIETGKDYDLHIAHAIFRTAVDELLSRAKSYNVSRILFPIGQDFFQINNQQGTTAAGTVVDTDGRLAKVYGIGVEAVMEAIEACLQVAPVDMLWVPGNHDPETSWYMVREIKAYFRHEKDLLVDAAPTYRKAYQWGKNGIFFTHGNEEPLRDLPAILASEFRDIWGQTLYNEVHCGHFHKRKETSFVAADTFGGGIVVRTIPSLSSADAWHYRKGWSRSPRAADAFLWGEEPGLAGYFSAQARDPIM